jgi:hypothetical protein
MYPFGMLPPEVGESKVELPLFTGLITIRKSYPPLKTKAKLELLFTGLLFPAKSYPSLQNNKTPPPAQSFCQT